MLVRTVQAVGHEVSASPATLPVIVTCEGDHIVEEVRLADDHACHTPVLDMSDMDVKVV